MMRMTGILVVMVSGLSGCTPSGGGGGGGGGEADCRFGDLRPCECPDGEQSTRVCDEDGAFGECRCGPGADSEDASVAQVDAGPECDLGDLVACECPNGRVSDALCVDGEFAACRCGDFRFVIIVDDSFVSGGGGVDGADICGLSAECPDGEVRTGLDATLIVGGGEVCDGSTTEPPCTTGINRQDPNTALDAGSMCDPANNVQPPSHYASLGLSGQLTVEFGVDLQGCTLTVVEHAGRDDEPYDVYLCESDEFTAETCLLDGSPIGSTFAGGPLQIDVPIE